MPRPKANPLIGYAFLKVNFDENKTHALDLIVPLARRALYNWRSKYIIPEQLQEQIDELWGMHIPTNVIRYLLPKLRTPGYVTFDEIEKRYKPNPQKLDDPNIKDKEKQAREIYQRLLARLKPHVLRYGEHGLTEREVLERFLDTGGLAFLQGQRLPPQSDRLDILSSIIVSQAIGVINGAADTEVIDDLVSLVIGDILYTAIASITEGESLEIVGGRMENVTVFLDTGLILRALGFFGNERRKPTKEMLDICAATGCNLAAFRHTVDEVTDGIAAVASRLYTGSDAFGPIVEYAIEEGLSYSDLLAQTEMIEANIIDLGIKIDETPPITPEFSIDETLLEWQIETDVKQDNPKARVRDVTSLAAIFRLRKAEPKKTLENCGAIFITSKCPSGKKLIRWNRL